MFRLRTEHHVASLNMTFYKCAVKLPFSLPIIFCKSSLIRPPKLVYLKYTSRIQTVNCFFRGGEVLPIKGHRPRACGWEAYLPLNPNGRSGARHQPLATERRKRQGCGVVYLHNAPICTLAIPTSIASGTYRRLVLHLQPHNCEHICACLL